MNDIYDLPRYYDLAFAWRDIPAECDFLVDLYTTHRGRPPSRSLELACGPGEHSRILASRGLSALGLDRSASMIRYARGQPGGDLPSMRWVQADMGNFALDEPVDLAFCLVDSLSHLLDLDALLTHLDAVARATTPDGLYLIEQSHPRDAFPFGETAQPAAWSMEDESGTLTVHVSWGQPDDPFDFATQIAELTVGLRVEEAGETAWETESSVPSRLWLAGEMEAAIRASGGWRIAARFGAMDASVPWQSAPPAWRMVTLLERHP